jgi:hypothetical protein
VAEREPPAQVQQQLINRVLSSRQFAHAHMLKRVLLFLVECSRRGGAPPKEYEIAVGALGRPESFDPRTDPIVRVSVASIRNRLAAYFATEGREEAWRLWIPKGQYRVVFEEAVEAETSEVSPGALARFWAPYFSGRSANIIVYTEPLFFRDNRGHFFRDWYVNDPGAAERVEKKLEASGLGPFEPAYHYLSSGEVHCLLSLSRLFHESGVPVETRSCRITSWNELRHANLILLGSPRTNPFLSSLQGEEPWIVQPDCIQNRDPLPGEQATYRGSRRLDGKLARRTEYAVVTRRPGLSPSCAITWIAANHGRAIEGAGHLLTLEDQVQRLLAGMGVWADAQVPERFQLLMQVEMIDLSDEVVQATCVSSRVLAPAAGARF